MAICDECKHYLVREQGIHETYLAGICTFQNREKFIASEVDSGNIETPKWCPLKNNWNRWAFKKNPPLNTEPRTDPYE